MPDRMTQLLTLLSVAFILGPVWHARAQGHSNDPLAVPQDPVDRLIERLRADLNLDDHQATLCRHFVDEFIDARPSWVPSDRTKLDDDWQRSYWLKRMPYLKEDAPMPEGVTQQESINIHVMRLKLNKGLPPIPDDPDYKDTVASIKSASTVVHMQRRIDAESAMIHQIKSVLSETQLSQWNRASRRFRISLHDTELWGGGGGCPNFKIAALGLVNETTADGAELEHLGSEGSRLLDSYLAQFEPLYLAALEQSRQSVLKYHQTRVAISNGDADQDDLDDAIDHVREAGGAAWRRQFQFFDQIARLAREHIDDDAARAWTIRFYTRVCPYRFLQPDRIDRLENWLPTSNVRDKTIEQLERIISEYKRARLNMRRQLAHKAFDVRCCPIEDMENTRAELEELEQKRQQLEERTARSVVAMLGTSAPTFLIASGAEDDL